MNSEVRLKSKFLLSKNTLRLFLISFTSFVLRYGFFAGVILEALAIYNSVFFKNLLKIYDDTVVFTVFAFAEILIFTVALIFSAAVKGGESFVFFTRSQGAKGHFSLLFKYLTPQKAFTFFRLYLKINALKLLWLIYFLLPFSFCFAGTYYLYSSSYLSRPVYYILCIGSSLLLSISLIMWRFAVLRYSASPYYLCLNIKRGVNFVINKSIRFTDGFLADGVVLEYSSLGWILSCIFIAPIIYVVPYLKLTKTVFVSQAVFGNVPQVKTTYAVNFLKSGEHIN